MGTNAEHEVEPANESDNDRTISKKRWVDAFKSVKLIGFRRLEEHLYGAHLKEGELAENMENSSRGSAGSSSHDAEHVWIELSTRKSCDVCKLAVGGGGATTGAGIRCKHCKIALHPECEHEYRKPCSGQQLSVPKLFRKQRSTDSANSAKSQEEEPKEIDPVYLMLKQAKTLHKDKMAHSAHSSTTNVGPDVAATATTSHKASADKLATVTDKAAQLSLSDKTRENKGGSVPSLAVKPSGQIEAAAAAAATKSNSSRSTSTSEHAPKLDSRKKSLSLDSPADGNPSMYYPSNRLSAINHIPHRMRTDWQQNSIETSDETERSSTTSCSPCPSPYASNSMNALNTCGIFVALRNYKAKFPEELDLRAGERVLVLDSSDPEWWQGSTADGKVGIFPVVFTARVYPSERACQIQENIQLCEGNKSLKLYRHQVVFHVSDDPDGRSIWIRTADEYKAKCPLEYLNFLE